MKYWLRYSKGGALRFVGHLDMLHTWDRILRRAQVPMAFTQGFSPRPILSLAAPLPVGLYSRAEYLELETTEEIPDLQDILQPVLPAGMQILGVAEVPARTRALMGLIRYGDYIVKNFSEAQLAILSGELDNFLAQQTVLQEVRRKSGLRTINLRPLVRSALLQAGQLQLQLALGSVANLRVENLLQYFALPVTELHISREELYLEHNEQLVTPFQYLACQR